MNPCNCKTTFERTVNIFHAYSHFLLLLIFFGHARTNKWPSQYHSIKVVGGCERVSEVAFATFTAKEKGKSRKGEFSKLLVQFCKHMTFYKLA